jgi:hypothetical protein
MWPFPRGTEAWTNRGVSDLCTSNPVPHLTSLPSLPLSLKLQVLSLCLWGNLVLFPYAKA